jgi:hypothetical protein
MKFGGHIAKEPTARQEAYLRQASSVSQLAWNRGLDRWNEDNAAAKTEPDAAKRRGIGPSVEKLKSEWAAVRRIEFPWSLPVTKCTGTQALIELGPTVAHAPNERREAGFGIPLCQRHVAETETRPRRRATNLVWEVL